MLAGFHLQGSQHIVHAAQLSLFTVYRSRPTGIVNLREHHDTALVGIHLVRQLVGLVGCQLHHAQRVLLNSLS